MTVHFSLVGPALLQLLLHFLVHVDGNDIPADAAWHPRRWSYLDAAPDRRAPLFVREPEGEARVVPLKVG